MNWRAQAGEAWKGVRATARAMPNDWRSYGPAASSVAAHGLAVLLVATLVTAPVLRDDLIMRPLAVTLIPDLQPDVAPPPAIPEPQPAPAARPAPAPVVAEPIPAERRSTAPTADRPAPVTPGAGATEDDFFVPPPAETGAPLGLRGLLETDPCGQVIERLRGDCDSRWTALSEQGGLDYSPTLEELSKLYPGFQPPGPAASPFGIPKAPERLTRKPSLSGGQVMAPLGDIRSGVGTAGGAADQTGRLPPPSAMHADPAWELRPRWFGHD